MLSALHPKNHTVPVYRRTFRVARLQLHLDLWVAKQLARSKAGTGGAADSECEVHENAAVTEVGAEPGSIGSADSSEAGDGVRGNAAHRPSGVVLNRVVIVEPRPADAELEDEAAAAAPAVEVDNVHQVADDDNSVAAYARQENAVDDGSLSDEDNEHIDGAAVQDHAAEDTDDAAVAAHGQTFETAV